MADRTLTVRLRAVANEYTRVLDKAGKSAEQFANRTERISAWGDKATDTGGKLTRGLTLPIAAVGAAAVAVAGNFDASMREVQALTSATGGEFEKLQGQALKMGADTQFSANEAAQAMAQLVKGGFDVNQTYSALPGVMQLAAASSIDIATAADIATNVLSGFGLEVADLAEVNDYLAQTANASDTDVRELGEAFKYVGPVAKGAGLSLQETTATLGLLAENGIRGSMAGTSLRGMLTALLAPSEKVAGILAQLGIDVVGTNGKLLPMVQIVDQLAKSGATTGQVMEIFGQRAGPAMVALMAQGSGALERFNGLLEESGGVAQNLADAKMGGLNGAIEQLKGSLETLAITAGENGLSGMIQGIASGFTSMANAMSAANPMLVSGGLAIAGIAAASGPAIWALGKMAGMYGPVVAGASSLVASLRSLPALFALMRTEGLAALGALSFGPQAVVIAGVAAAVAVLAGAFFVAKRSADRFSESHVQAADAAAVLADSAGIATNELSALNDEQERAVVSSDDFRAANEATILTLRELANSTDQQAALMSIGYELVQIGGSPEDALREVTRIANAAGVEVPVNLTVENIGDFEHQVDAAVVTATRAMDQIRGRATEVNTERDLGKQTKAEIDSIARSAGEAFKTGNTAGFVEILAAASVELEGNAAALDYLTDRSLEYSEVAGLSTRAASDVAGAVNELGSEASAASSPQKDLLAQITRTAEGMDGGLTPANMKAAAALHTSGVNAQDYADAAAKVAGEAGGAVGPTEDFAGVVGETGDNAEDATDALDNYIDSIRGTVEPYFELADAVRANERANADLTDAQQELADLQAGMDPDELADGMRRIEDAARSVEDAYRSLEDATRDVEDAQIDLADINEDLAEMEADLVGVTPGSKEYDEGMDKLKDQRRRQRDAIRDIEDSERKKADAVRGIADAQRDHEEAQGDLRQAQLDAIPTAEELAEAHRNIAEAEQGVAESALDLTEATVRVEEGLASGALSADSFSESLQQWVADGLVGEATANKLAAAVMGVAFATAIATDAHERWVASMKPPELGSWLPEPPARSPGPWRSGLEPAAPQFQPNWRGPGRASGGGVAPYSRVMVGEFGPEILEMGGRGGSVMSNRLTEKELSAQMMPAQAMSGFSDSRIVERLERMESALAGAGGYSATINVTERPGMRAEDIVRAGRSEHWLRTGRR